ncbi:hypothetical protein FRC14_004157 [Serendipita sp. 396]|nr:hypothetical protein FRC14_004157 [Serendipita sp. 396]KAG8802991.1 hypothetical protein FRC16_007925 [Serendipita sp. 398]
MSGSRSMEVEVIELSDSEGERTGDAVIIQRLQRNLRKSRMQNRLMKEKNEQLQKEIGDLKERLYAFRGTDEDEGSHSEITRVLNQELIQVNKLAQDHYGKYTREKQKNTQYTTVVDDLWRAVECPVCFEPLWEPAVYFCGHVVCQNCINVMCGHCRGATGGHYIKLYAMHDIVQKLAPIAVPREMASQLPR